MGKNAPTYAGYSPESLERVSGIGPKTAEALAQIGIRRLADLAQSTPNALATALFEQVGLRVSPERIEAMDWIGQAQALLQQLRDEQAALPPPTAVDQAPIEMPTVASIVGKPPRPQQYAGFTLWFDCEQGEEGRQSWQTYVYHEETGVDVWIPGTVSRTWLDWILKQAKLPADIEPEPASLTPPTTPETVPTSATTLAIRDVEVSERPQLTAGSQRLVAEIRFEVVDFNAEALNAVNTAYQILLLTVDQNSYQTKLIISEQGSLQATNAVHRHELEFPVPELGRYELLTIMLVQGQAELVAYYRGPIVTIVPKARSNWTVQ